MTLKKKKYIYMYHINLLYFFKNVYHLYIYISVVNVIKVKYGFSVYSAIFIHNIKRQTLCNIYMY